MVKSGKVRYIGASSMRSWRFARALGIAERHGWTRIVGMQNLVNLLYREEEREARGRLSRAPVDVTLSAEETAALEVAADASAPGRANPDRASGSLADRPDRAGAGSGSPRCARMSAGTTRSTSSAARGIVLLTSRVSVEMVQKAAVMGAPIIVAISAPTGLALRTAEAAGITLAAIARDDGFELFTHPRRIELKLADHVA